MSGLSRREAHEFAQIFSGIKADDHDDDQRDEYWQTVLDSYHEDIPWGYWHSNIQNITLAAAMAKLQQDSEKYVRLLYKHRARSAEGTRISSAPMLRPRPPFRNNPRSFLAYNERLHSRWMMLFYAMAGTDCWKSFTFKGLGMPKALLGMIASALSSRNSYRKRGYIIRLTDNQLDQESMGNLSSLLRGDGGLCMFLLGDNVIGSICASKISSGMKSNKFLQLALFRNCGLGRNTRALATMMDAFASNEKLSYLYLDENCIRSRGAVVIANFIASNPKLRQLDLKNNELNDSDARIFAQALQTNNQLNELRLQNNKFSRTGVDVLAKAVFHTTDLNTLFD